MLSGHDFRNWTILCSVPMVIAGVLCPEILKKPYEYWIQLGNVLGLINSYIILGIVFIFILQPIALLMRLTGHDPMKVTKGNSKTYRERRDKAKIDLTRIF